MISKNEAAELMNTFVELKNKLEMNKSKKDEIRFRMHEQICIEKFSYMISMKISKYRKFANYEDINQEALEALYKCMYSFNPNKGNFFGWAHLHLDSKISRAANKHSVIHVPMNRVKNNRPDATGILPSFDPTKTHPENDLEKVQMISAIENAFQFLSNQQKNIVSMAYGLSGDKPYSTNMISKRLDMSRQKCIRLLKNANKTIRNNILI